METHAFVERPAQAARTHNPTPIHLSSPSLCNVAVYVLNSESKKAPLEGGLGGEP